MRHPVLALPRILGALLARATQYWHCQGFLACGARTPLRAGTARIFWHLPPSIGTAKDFWHARHTRHSTLALPRILGALLARAPHIE